MHRRGVAALLGGPESSMDENLPPTCEPTTVCCRPGNWTVGRDASRPTIVCLGDSHTQGMYGPNWVSALRKRYPQSRIVNCGINGEVMESIRRRAKPTLRRHKNVVGVVVLGGTNDCLQSINKSAHALIHMHNLLLKKLPALDNYSRSMTELLEGVHQTFPNCPVAYLTLPMLTEDIGNMPNGLVDRVNVAIRDTGAKFSFVRILDLNTAMKNYIATHTPARPPVPIKHSFFHTAAASWWSILTEFFVPNMSWNRVADRRGRLLLHDDIHFNEHAASLLLDLLTPFVEDLRVQTHPHTTAATGLGNSNTMSTSAISSEESGSCKNTSTAAAADNSSTTRAAAPASASAPSSTSSTSTSATGAHNTDRHTLPLSTSSSSPSTVSSPSSCAAAGAGARALSTAMSSTAAQTSADGPPPPPPATITVKTSGDRPMSAVAEDQLKTVDL